MKKALIYIAVIFFLFIIVSRACSGCKKHKPAANNDNVSENAGSDIESGTIDDSGLTEDDPIPDPVVDESNPNNVVVVVKGNGETFTEAKQDAMRNAVEQVVGALVDAQTRVENDELIEQILTASSAYIEKNEVLSTKKANGMITVKLQATVVKLSLTKKLRLSEGGQTIAVDGANLVDMANSKVDAEKSGAMFLANFLKKEEFPYSLLDTKVLGQPQITQKGDEVIYSLRVEASVNRERYMDFVKRVKPIFDKYAIEQSSFIIEPYFSDKAIQYEDEDAPGEYYNGNHLPFYLCTGVTGNFRSLKFELYELPKKFRVPLRYYKRVASVVEISLLDGDSEVVATKRALLGSDRSGLIEPLNVMPSMFYSLEINNPKVFAESTIIGSNSDMYFRTGWSVFAPYRHEKPSYGTVKNLIIPSYIIDVSIVLSPDELAKVRTAKIAVIVNNPDMDKAFERMPEEIDQVPTN